MVRCISPTSAKANGILGAGAPLICGAGIAAKFRGDGGVRITFFGDGASNQGMVLVPTPPLAPARTPAEYRGFSA